MAIKKPESSKDRIVLALDVDTIDEVEEIVMSVFLRLGYSLLLQLDLKVLML